ncbi:Ferritin light chain 1 [Myotis brandtii]|uniref:Ferritin n=1 Tax=Myotis brandtii TaxID=109478 RepID=S7Q6S7_MYOBR|nr:Ferritin light chain 1 [Myotis brandtii]
MSSQIRQNYFTEMEAAINRLANLHLQVSYTYLSLGFYFDHNDVALEGVGQIVHKLAKETHKGSEHLLKMQNQQGGHSLFRDMLKSSQGEWGETQKAMEAAVALVGREPEPGPFGSACPGFYPDPHLCDFLEYHFLDEKVKLITKMGNT